MQRAVVMDFIFGNQQNLPDDSPEGFVAQQKGPGITRSLNLNRLDFI
jgi:hypothetical protein